MARKHSQPDILLVDIFEAKANTMFSEAQRSLVRFLRFSRAVPCAECGRKVKLHWTMRSEFVAKTVGPFVLTGTGKVFAPLTPVCTSHPLAFPPAGRKVRERSEHDHPSTA